MSGQGRRAKIDIDYNVFHETGEKIPKRRDTMDLNEKFILELQIKEDISESYSIYDIKDLESKEELTEGMVEISELGKKYRHVHVELKNLMGETDYAEKYGDYEKTCSDIREYIKSVRTKIKNCDQAEQKKVFEVTEGEKTVEEDRTLQLRSVEVLHARVALQIEEQVFGGKIERELKNFDLDNPVCIQKSLDRFEQILDDYYKLFSSVKITFGDAFEAECLWKNNFETNFEKLENQIKVGKAKMMELDVEAKNLESQGIENREKKVNEQFVSEQKFNCETLGKELALRCDALIKKCDLSVLSTMTDYQIFECNNKRYVIDTEMREIFDKFTSFSKVAATLPGERDALIKEPHLNQQKALEARNDYAKKLHALMCERDISAEKLRNASTITVELAKFKGYESKLDIYSFRSEFEKLIQPSCQKHLWVDTLKNNYLAGPAFTLVERTESLSEIWEKLTGAYGNVRLLLQNKIAKLDKFESLDKIKDDDKMIIALAKIINMMGELKSLAEKHNLETKLYVGGGLEKILSLIGSDSERRFFAKYVDKLSSSGSSTEDTTTDSIPEKQDWKNLTEYLEKQLAIREKLALVQKSKDTLGVKPDPKSGNKDGGKPPRGGNSANVGDTREEAKCHLCGEKGHVKSVDRSGKFHIDYVACKKFVNWSCKERLREFMKRSLCMQCLTPGIKKFNKDHNCFDSYVCTHQDHAKYPKGLHVLLCENHKTRQENIDLLKEYMKNVISKRSDKFETFTKNISLVCLSDGMRDTCPVDQETKGNVLPDIPDRACFQLQTINVKGRSGSRNIRLFYDGGCGDMVINWKTIKFLKSIGRATLLKSGPLPLIGVGGHESFSEYGIYRITLPLSDGNDATFSGLCLDQVTAELPRFPLKEIEGEIRQSCHEQGGSALVDALPRLPAEIGGETDILLGIQYKRYHPVDVWESPSGLTISRSRFLSADGTTGVIGGPHPKFTEILAGMHTPVLVLQVVLYRAAYMSYCNMPILGEKYINTLTLDDSSELSISPDDPETQYYPLGPADSDQQLENSSSSVCLLGPSEYSDQQLEGSSGRIFQCHVCTCNVTSSATRRPPRSLKRFEEIENAGTEVTYRCVGCRNCKECKRSSRIDAISFEEEVQQDLINRCVKVDIDNFRTTHELPFMTEPDGKLSSTEFMARKIYQSIVKTLANKPERKKAALESEGKLQRLGYVEWFENLDPEVREMILNSFRYFITWRLVFNENSLSTPCRVVFDASCSPKGGCSLNMLLAKGTNNMNKLISILIRWFIQKIGFHTDIAKMYNGIGLDKKHWRYQLYFWDDQLREGVAPRWKVILTAIYGVISSGNVAECAVRKIAEMLQSEFPKAHDTINNDLYVDDCISGDMTLSDAHNKADQLSAALSKGGFALKGFTFSGDDPPEELTKDGVSILVGGIRWWSKSDLISIVAANPAIKKFLLILNGKIPGKVTRKNCVSGVASVFDPPGLLIPLTSGFKIDITEFCMRKLNWDDEIPEELRKIWIDNFEMIEEIKTLQFRRAVVPDDAVDLNVETLDFGDASQRMICVAIYARFKRRSGGFSCQLVFSRSKVVPQDMSQPRAEALALELNAKTGHVVKTAFGDRHVKCLKFSDSQVAIHWVACTKTRLKLWVRNRAIEFNRLSDINDLRYVDSKNMIADLGTRKGVTIDDVRPDSDWINGFEWMRGDVSDFPVKTIDEMVMRDEAKCEADKEKINIDSLVNHAYSVRNPIYLPTRFVPSTLRDRYQFSLYLIDPNMFRFRKVVRVLGLVMLFVHKILTKIKRSFIGISGCSEKKTPDMMSYRQGDQYLVTTGKNAKQNLSCTPGLVIELPILMINAALNYFYVKATNEIKQFVSVNKYENITVERDGILYYTSRILPTQQFSGDLTLCDTSFDLTSSTFCVPVVDHLSPVAYAVANEVHWYHADVKHGGVESMLREIQCVVHVIGGRSLVKNLKNSCPRCRALEKKLLEVAMGPKPESMLCIAPAFHNSQVDICGPFDSFSNSNKRAKVKVWFSVFCCCTTGAVDCKVMEDYSTDSFVLAFIRFACRYGYPCNLYPDYGSQLIKGCKDMVLSFSDIKHKLHSEFGVQFQPCPVGAHNFHGKVERKIKEIKRSFEKEFSNQRLSIIQWETLAQQVVNSINNLPIGLGNKVESLENIDLVTPNRLLLGRNNNRSPTEPLLLSQDVKKIISTNADIFRVWFKAWLVSCVPVLIEQPKWFKTSTNLQVGDVVLFLKNEKELETQYQYGMVSKVYPGNDGLIRSVDVDYQNHNENVRRTTKRGVRNLVVIHPVDEIGISQELSELCEDNNNHLFSFQE